MRADSLLAAAWAIVLYRYTRTASFSLLLKCGENSNELAIALEDEMSGGEVARGIETHAERSGTNGTLPSLVLGDGDVELSFKVGHEIEVQLSHAASLEPASMRRSLGHLETVLGGLIADAQRPLADLPLLTDAERKQLLIDWNATRAAFAENKTLHELFEEVVRRSPGAIALVHGEQQLTYAELNRRANRLAHRLIAMGIRPETLVGICLERTPALVVAVLGVLKAGGAYVPLDPANPPARLQMILDDAKIALLVTQSSLRELFAGAATPSVDAFDDDTAFAEDDPPRRAVPANAAYVIYTSGSTGKPKGTIIEHRSLTAFVGWTQSAFDPEELSGVLLATSIAFDVSVFELFAPLCAGGSAILVDDLLGLADAPAADAVRIVAGTAAGLRALVNTTVLPAGARTVMQAGERLDVSLANALHAQPGVRRVVNLCGATEDTVYSVSYEVPPHCERNPPVGRPFQNREAYVLDARLRPVPV
ncbi:MAG: AMP-binding protein, partial [Candidatus Eremiobacteraeota bacterium]|nr:AMP-binding protein [Candidatus Eremiobacteraeota bacterium]